MLLTGHRLVWQLGVIFFNFGMVFTLINASININPEISVVFTSMVAAGSNLLTVYYASNKRFLAKEYFKDIIKAIIIGALICVSIILIALLIDVLLTASYNLM